MIQVNNLFEAVSGRFSASGSRFTRVFLDSVNRVSDDLRAYTGLDVSLVTNLQESIDADRATYWGAYFDGTIFYMQTSGEWSKEPDARAEARYSRAIGLSQSRVMEDSPAGLPDGDS